MYLVFDELNETQQDVYARNCEKAGNKKSGHTPTITGAHWFQTSHDTKSSADLSQTQANHQANNTGSYGLK